MLAELFQQYGKPSYALARRICADEGLAEQVVLEVFLALWRELRRGYVTSDGLTTWLLNQTHRRAVEAVRRHSAGPPVGRRAEPDAEPDTAGPEAVPFTGPDSREAQLTPVQRRVLALAYFGGCTQREIAALTGLPLETVKSEMVAGIQRLRGLLNDQDGRAAVVAEGRAMGEVDR